MIGLLGTIIEFLRGLGLDLTRFLAFLVHGLNLMFTYAHNIYAFWALIPIPLQLLAAGFFVIMVVRLAVSLGGH